MKTEQIEARDRAEPVFVQSVPCGGFNAPMEVVASEDGLTIDEFVVVPWEWIDRARATISLPSPPAEVSGRI